MQLLTDQKKTIENTMNYGTILIARNISLSYLPNTKMKNNYMIKIDRSPLIM